MQPSIRESIDQYNTGIQNTRSDYTARTYRTGVSKFVEYLVQAEIDLGNPAVTLTVQQFIRFPDWLNGLSYALATRETYRAAVNGFWNWLIIHEYIIVSVSDMMRYKSAAGELSRVRSSRLPRTPSARQVEIMLESVRGMNFRTPARERNIAILEFLASSGCRVGEVARLRVEDIDDENRQAIVTGKGDKERIVFFSSVTALCLTEYWKIRKSCDPGDPVFSRHDRRTGRGVAPMTPESYQNIVRQVSLFAGLKNFTPHVFRHGFATEMLDKTGNLAAVQEFLGHSDPSATRVYARLRPGKLKQLYDDVFNKGS